MCAIVYASVPMLRGSLSTVAAVVACVYFSMRGDRLRCLSPVLLGWCQVLRHQSGCSPGAARALSEIWSVQIWTATAMVRFARCGERYVRAVRELTSLGYGSVLRVQAGYWLARRALAPVRLPGRRNGRGIQ